MAIYQYAMGFDIFTSLPNFQNLQFEIVENEDGEQELGEGTLMAEGTVSSPLAIIYNNAIPLSINMDLNDIQNHFQIYFQGANRFSSIINKGFIYAEKQYDRKNYSSKFFVAEKVPFNINELKTNQLILEDKKVSENINYKIAHYHPTKEALYEINKSLGEFESNKKSLINSDLYRMPFISEKESVVSKNFILHRKNKIKINNINNNKINLAQTNIRKISLQNTYYLYNAKIKIPRLFTDTVIFSIKPDPIGMINEEQWFGERNEILGLENKDFYFYKNKRPLGSLIMNEYHTLKKPLIQGTNIDIYSLSQRSPLIGLDSSNTEVLTTRYDLELIINEFTYSSVAKDKVFYNLGDKLRLSNTNERNYLVSKLINPVIKKDSLGYKSNIANYQISKLESESLLYPLSIIGNYKDTEIELLDTIYYLDKIIKGFIPENTLYLNKADKNILLSKIISKQFEFAREKDFSEILDMWNQDKAGKYDFLSVPDEDFNYEEFSLDPDGIPYYIIPGQDLGKASIKVLYPKNNFHPETKDVGKTKMNVSLEAFYDVVLVLHSIYKKDFYKLAGMYSDEALMYVINLLKEYLIQDNKWSLEYQRLFRFCRWYAESTLIKLSTFVLRRNYVSYEIRNYITVPENLSEDYVMPIFIESNNLGQSSVNQIIKFELTYPKGIELADLDLHLLIYKGEEFIGKISYTEYKEIQNHDVNYYFDIDENIYSYLVHVDDENIGKEYIIANNMYGYSLFICLSNYKNYVLQESDTVNITIYENDNEIKSYNIYSNNLISDDFDANQKVYIISCVHLSNLLPIINDIGKISDINNLDYFKEQYTLYKIQERIPVNKFTYFNSFDIVSEFESVLRLTSDKDSKFIFIKENFIDGYFSFSYIISLSNVNNAESQGSGRFNIYIDRKLVLSTTSSGMVREEFFFVEKGIHLYEIEYIGTIVAQIYNMGITGVVYQGAVTECIDDNNFLGLKKVEMMLDKIFKYYEEHHLRKVKGAESLMQRKLWI